MSEQLQLAEEAVITSHRLLERLASGEQGLELPALERLVRGYFQSS